MSNNTEKCVIGKDNYSESYYNLTNFEGGREPTVFYMNYKDKAGLERCNSLVMQNGPRGEFGANGFLDEEVLKFIKARFEYFLQCADDIYTAKALEHLTYAINALDDRKAVRTQKGIEGTSANT